MIIGITQKPTGAHHALLVDEANILDIELLNTSMSLAMRDISPLANDAPTFWIGGEFVRVGRVAALGSKRYQLSRFSRTNFSSLVGAPSHAAGAQVVLMDVAFALIVPEAYFNVGQTVTLEAQGLGDSEPVSTSVVAAGLAITPLAPVHGRAVKDASGNIDLQWKRRWRLDLGWVDGVDQALAEDGESYRVELHAGDTLLREWIVAESSLRISASELAGAGAPLNSTPIFSVQQIGRFAQSGPLNIALNRLASNTHIVLSGEFMPDLETGRHRLPLLAVSQAQKEITPNEALVLIDALMHMAVETSLSTAPMATDNDIGKCWIINETPTGLWANKAGQIAFWIGGSWRFIVPHEGMRVWNKATRRHSFYIAGQWVSAPAISNPTGGTAVDSEARAALGTILQYFRSIGILAN